MQPGSKWAELRPQHRFIIAPTRLPASFPAREGRVGKARGREATHLAMSTSDGCMAASPGWQATGDQQGHE